MPDSREAGTDIYGQRRQLALLEPAVIASVLSGLRDGTDDADFVPLGGLPSVPVAALRQEGADMVLAWARYARHWRAAEMATTFDTLEFVETLEKGGIDRKHAETFARAVRKSQEAALEDFTKAAKEAGDQAVKDLDSKTEKALLKLENEVALVRNEVALVRKDIELVSKDLLIKLGGGLIAAVTLLLAAIGLAVRYLSQ